MPSSRYSFYNLAPPDKPHRDPAQVQRELHALLDDHPLVLGLAEAIGHGLGPVPGYRLIRDTSRPGRANVAAYVSRDVPLSAVEFHDLHHGWPRTEHPGTHDPRSFLTFRAGGDRVMVAHMPPDVAGAGPARAESAAAIRLAMAPWQREDWTRRSTEAQLRARAAVRVLLMDANGLQADIALAIGGGAHLVGRKLDCAVVTGLAKGEDATYPTSVHGVRLWSDHGDAFTFRLVRP